jgi:beta-lactamase class A
MDLPPRRRVRRTPERAPWPFWWGSIGVGLAGLVLLARALHSPTPPVEAARPLPTLVIGVPLQLQATAATAFVAEPTQATLTPSATPLPTSTSPPMPTPVSVPVESRFSPTSLQPDPELASLVLSILNELPGHIGVAIKDIQTGRGVLIDPNSEFEAASVFKLEVMYEVFKQRELGALSFDETLFFNERHVAYDLGTLDRPAGSPIQLDEALERMITISDNSSALLLTDRVGAFNINRDLGGLGLSRTHLIEDQLTTSPLDMLSFMEMLARGEGVSPQASREMLQLMARQRINDRIPRLLPGGISVAHKTGNLSGVVNDVGLVSAPETTFAIAVLISDTPAEGQGAQAIADIAAAAYRYFRTAQPSMTPTPSVTPTPVETETPTPGPATATSVATPTGAATSVPTAAATRTAGPSPTPTRTPTPVR